jgi:hypothetical protein
MDFENVLSIVVIARDRRVYFDEPVKVIYSFGESTNLRIGVATPQIGAFKLPRFLSALS